LILEVKQDVWFEKQNLKLIRVKISEFINDPKMCLNIV